MTEEPARYDTGRASAPTRFEALCQRLRLYAHGPKGGDPYARQLCREALQELERLDREQRSARTWL